MEFREQEYLWIQRYVHNNGVILFNIKDLKSCFLFGKGFFESFKLIWSDPACPPTTATVFALVYFVLCATDKSRNTIFWIYIYKNKLTNITSMFGLVKELNINLDFFDDTKQMCC